MIVPHTLGIWLRTILPRCRTSLVVIAPCIVVLPGHGVLVGVLVAVPVGLMVGVSVGVTVGVELLATVRVLVGVFTSGGVFVGVKVGAVIGVRVRVAVLVGVNVGSADVLVAVDTGVYVPVGVGVMAPQVESPVIRSPHLLRVPTSPILSSVTSNTQVPAEAWPIRSFSEPSGR